MKLIYEQRITYALSKDTGKLMRITDVPNGLACNCICSVCGESLIARQGEKNRPSFAHKQGTTCNGHAAFESMVHLLSKEIIGEYKALALPDYIDKTGEHRFYATTMPFSNVEIERTDDKSGKKPDCTGYVRINGNEIPIWIEINNTHSVEEDKRKYLQENRIYCVEVDVSQFADEEEIDKDKLKKYLLEDTNPFFRRWINYPERPKQKKLTPYQIMVRQYRKNIRL